MSEALVIFNAIHDELKKQMLLQKILSTNETILLKDKSENSIELKPISINSNANLKCNTPENTNMNVQEGQVYTVSFHLSGEKYIFETRPTLGTNHVTLTVLNLFHLQKRRHYRYILPKDYSASLIVKQLNRNQCSHSCHLLDLSTEGCAVTIPQEEANLNVEDIISAEIVFAERNPIPVQGVIKNIRIKDESFFVLGVEFDHIAHSSEEKIINCITDLQRDIYFRKAS